MNITEFRYNDVNYKVSHSFYNALILMLIKIYETDIKDDEKYISFIFNEFDIIENKVAYFYDLTLNDWYVFQEINDKFKEMIKLYHKKDTILQEEFYNYITELVDTKINN